MAYSRELVLACVKGDTVDFETACKTPGVYKLGRSDSGPAVVFLRSGQRLHVCFGSVQPLEKVIPNPQTRTFWKTDIEAPEEVLP